MKFIFQYIILITFFCISNSVQSNNNIPFRSLNSNDGLTNNQVYSIIKDQTGFIWIGTTSGLNRFDGTKFVTYKHIQNDSSTISDNFVLKIIEDKTGVLWILSRNSMLSFYHPTKESFTRNSPIFNKSIAIPNIHISDINTDNQGNIWITNSLFGIYHYNFENDSIFWLRNIPNQPNSISSNNVSSIQQGNNGLYWSVNQQGILEKIDPQTFDVIERIEVFTKEVGNEKENFRLFVDSHNDVWVYSESRDLGVVQFIDATKDIVRFNSSTSADIKIVNDIITGITQDKEGVIWIGTDHGGIIQYDKRTRQLNNIKHNRGDALSLPHNSITALYTDDTGIVWVGMYKKGLAYYHPDFFKFDFFTNNPFNNNSLNHNDVNCFTQDYQGNIWIGTNGKGLNRYSPSDKKFTFFNHDPRNTNTISNDVIISLLSDSKNRLWIGTYFGGLNLLEGSKITHYTHKTNDESSIANNRIWSLFEDSRGTIWIGTLGGGVDSYNPENESFTHYSGDSNDYIHSDFIYSIEEDNAGNMWFGCIYGVHVLNPYTKETTTYINNPNLPNSISSNRISVVKKDTRGWMWIGTSDGLNLYNESTNTFRAFRREDGLPENDIMGLECDSRGNLWITTTNGLSNMIITDVNNLDFSFTFKNYNESDGLQGASYTERATFITKEGHILVGGANGFNMFDPHSINSIRKTKRVELINFELFNKTIKPNQLFDNQIILKKSIQETQEITLRHKDNIFSIEFKSLDFFHPERLTYQYKVDGFTPNWLTLPEGINTATLTNLNPGKYTFRVRSSYNGKNWSPVRNLSIIIKPALLASNLAKVIYLVIAILLIIYFRNFIQNRERLKHQLATAEKDAIQKQEITNLKTKFITNVSHEFRTPLTLILAHTEKLNQNKKFGEFSKQLTMIEKNGKRLLQLVNQLLDFRKMEINQLKLNISHGDVIAFLKETMATFYDLSDAKNIELQIESEDEAFEAYFDHDKLEKIVFNLLSNAFKFTPNSGSIKALIQITHKGENSNLELEVSDTGVGIPAEMQSRIFERFFQQENDKTFSHNGTGVGLALTKQFVELHGGTISVESAPGEGSTFYVSIPLPTIKQVKKDNDIKAPEETIDTINDTNNTDNTNNPKHTILVIEDNNDLRQYLVENLQSNYKVIAAENGKLGWETLLHTQPDLVVSDVMMPEMDGIELCDKIKNDARTSHIPVILLTAKSSTDHKLEGLQTGADDYITKPFSFELLALRIRNNIDSREKLRRKFSKNIAIEPSEITVTSLDEKLLSKLIKKVDLNIENEDFSVEILSQEMGVSRAHLYKKLVALTGKTPVQFIRIMRMKRAATLLKESQLTVTEVSYKVGYSGARYFSKHFKEEFNCSPSDFKTL